MKRALIFSLAYYPFVGGDGVAIREITKRIDPKEIEFHMVTLRFDTRLPQEEKIGNVVVHRIGWSDSAPTPEAMRGFKYRLLKLWFQFAAAFFGMRLHRKEKFDAIWAMMAHSAGVPAALFKIFYPKVPFILSLQEGDPIPYIEKTMRPLWPLFSRAFTSANAVQAISTYLGEWARKRGFKGTIEIIPNGVDLEHFSKKISSEEHDALKVKVGKKEGDIFLITTSRLVRKNAVDDVIRALPFLPENVHFLILGVGPEEETLRALAKGLGVENRTRFLGFVAHAQMPAYLAVSDIFIRPSRSEGMGNSFIEAMAAGLPVIATREGGIADFLFDAKLNPGKETTGWAVHRDSPHDIAEAVKEIVSDKNATSQVIEHARAMVKDTYGWEKIAKDMREHVFNRILKQE